ncbi:MAG: biotin--[acetyl-CoA-carboxylase] ligase [Reyranellaceae bacterium]
MSTAEPVLRHDLALPAGWRLIAFETVGSTNDEAMQRADRGAEEGTVVWARRQVSGRGRRGRVWQSPEGNLYSSIVVRPDSSAEVAAQLSFVTALAVGDTVAAHAPAGPRIGFKWPNDVQVDGAKIAGILLESAVGPSGQVRQVVVGTGINVGWRPAPGETPYPATSLAALGGEGALEPVLQTYCAAMARWIARWRQAGFAPIREAWLARAGNIGQMIEVKTGRDVLKGRFAQLDETGALILEDSEGRTTRVTAGEIFPVAA